MSELTDMTTTQDDGPVSTAFNVLLKRCGKTINQVSEATGISDKLLYAISKNNRSKADMRVLKCLANYFGVDMEAFAGIEEYEQQFRPTIDEILLLEKLRSMSKRGQQRAIAMMTASEEETAIVEQYRSLPPRLKLWVGELFGITEKEYSFFHLYKSLDAESQQLVENMVKKFSPSPSDQH